MPFYNALPESVTELQQGDLLSGVPFSYFSLREAGVILKDGTNTFRSVVGGEMEVEFVLAKVEYGWGIILSQTCDVQADPQTGFARKPLLIARVSPIKEIVQGFNDSNMKKTISSIRSIASAGSSPSVFYLPAYESEKITLPRSGAFLLDVQRFRPRELPILCGMAKLRLTEPALQALQERCAYCFGRFGVPDDLYYSPEEWATILS